MKRFPKSWAVRALAVFLGASCAFPAMGQDGPAISTRPGQRNPMPLPAADKQDHSGSVTRQYAGSLFEQSVLLAFDALFQALWSNEDQTAERLWERHANIG